MCSLARATPRPARRVVGHRLFLATNSHPTGKSLLQPHFCAIYFNLVSYMSKPTRMHSLTEPTGATIGVAEDSRVCVREWQA